MKEILPDLIVPMHCTGWKAITRFMHRPDTVSEGMVLFSPWFVRYFSMT
jgi:metal-dependent hydrolase (beta-lactamase superfamily II)